MKNAMSFKTISFGPKDLLAKGNEALLVDFVRDISHTHLLELELVVSQGLEGLLASFLVDKAFPLKVE